MSCPTPKRTASCPTETTRLFQSRNRAAMRWRVWLAVSFSILQTFFERKGLTRTVTNCLNMSAQPHCKRFMAYDNCQRYFAADACDSSTTTEVPYCVVCHDPCPPWARHLS